MGHSNKHLLGSEHLPPDVFGLKTMQLLVFSNAFKSTDDCECMQVVSLLTYADLITATVSCSGRCRCHCLLPMLN